MREQQEAGSQDAERRPSTLARDLTLYTLARLGMLAVGTGVLSLFHVPLLVAIAVVLVLVLVLSLSGLVFGGLQGRVAVGLAQRSARRKAQRERLRRELRADRETEAD